MDSGFVDEEAMHYLKNKMARPMIGRLEEHDLEGLRHWLEVEVENQQRDSLLDKDAKIYQTFLMYMTTHTDKGAPCDGIEQFLVYYNHELLQSMLLRRCAIVADHFCFQYRGSTYSFNNTIITKKQQKLKVYRHRILYRKWCVNAYQSIIGCFTPS